MTRINIYAAPDESDWMDDGKPQRLGWFDPAKAECFDQDRRHDGNNMVGVITHSEWVDEYLYRTSGGKWVLNHDAHRAYNGPDTYAFVTDEEAHDWLLRSECNDEAVKRFFGDVAEEEDRRPGRPAIGEAVNIRLGTDLLSMVDRYAAERSISRAEGIRRLVADAVTRTGAGASAPRSPRDNH
jgi:hypothetical protein